MAKRRAGIGLLVGVNLLLISMLGFFQMTSAAPPSANMPFANSVEQRMDMVNQLKELNAQIKELNAFLKSGNLKVVAVPEKK